MLKHGIKNYFQQITKTLSVCLGWNTAHTDLLLCKYVWLEQLNACAKYGFLSGENFRLIGQNLWNLKVCLKALVAMT